MNFKLTVKGIIKRGDGKILIVKRSKDDDHRPEVWETVGGGVEEMANPKEALAREIFEEVGLEIKVGEPFNVFSFVKDNGEFKIGITFICEYISGDIKLSHEHSEFKWIEAKDFKKLASVDSLYKEITDYSNRYSGEYERFVVSQKAILIRNNKCFISEINKRPGIWDLPGGRINKNENREFSFKREIEEELGIKNFKIIALVDYDSWRTENGFAVFATASLIESEEKITISDEHTDGKWVNEDEVDNFKFIWPVMSRMIKKGFKYYKLKNN